MKLAAIGSPLFEKEKMAQILRSLPDFSSHLGSVAGHLTYEKIRESIKSEMKRKN